MPRESIVNDYSQSCNGHPSVLTFRCDYDANTMTDIMHVPVPVPVPFLRGLGRVEALNAPM